MATNLTKYALGFLRSLKTLSYPPYSHNTIKQFNNSGFSERCYSSQVKVKLMEFFDSKENWEKDEVKVGRSWNKSELRIKSNGDLHKLWFVLLKERNMLLTMEHEYKLKYEVFPSAERIDKVKESMVNLEDVVRERNKAFWLLETGNTGERPGKLSVNQLGMHYFYKMSEHVLPEKLNQSWWKKRKLWYNRLECDRFLKLFGEKVFMGKKRALNRDKNHVIGLLKRFPDMDIPYLKEKYPHLDIEKLKTLRQSEGHFE